jgi:hypothetical protein
MSRAEWTQAMHMQRQRAEALVGAHVRRRERGEKHPVMDFLFDYYSFRPAHLHRWSPGPAVLLEGAEADEVQPSALWSSEDGGRWLDPARIPRQRHAGWRWILELLQQIDRRPPFFACGGLHEWAMVHRGEVRHPQVPLRMDPATLAAFVESQPIACSHFDAFRFFTPAARPLNRMQPERATRHGDEQRGCLHVNMDLYKWAYKLAPWVESGLVLDCLELAMDAREVDMRASPYDLRSWGMEPLPMETEAGRGAFAREQARLAESARPLRTRLIEAYLGVLS